MGMSVHAMMTMNNMSKLLMHHACTAYAQGDACLAFMAPGKPGGEASRALEVARQALQSQGPKIMAGLRVRMGINTGELLIRPMLRLSKDYACVCHATRCIVHARLQLHSCATSQNLLMGRCFSYLILRVAHFFLASLMESGTARH